MYRASPPNASPAIPTTYRGIRMRSRLEAKWACMFDLCGWRWEYEPLDLNGWIPDFLIHTKKRPVLVDVKPLLQFPDQALLNKIENAIGRINDVEWGGVHPDNKQFEVWVTSAFPLIDEEENDIAVGWLTDWSWGSNWSNAVLISPTLNKEVIGLAAGLSGGYWDRIANYADGDHHYRPMHYDDIAVLWAHATNTVQWKAPR